MDTQLALEQALLSAQSGDKKRARAILREVLRREPHNEPAWLLFAEFAEKPEQTVAWLEHLLKLNPEHAAARERLTALKASEVAKTQEFQPLLLPIDAPPSVAVPIVIPKQPISPTTTDPVRNPWLRGVGCAAVMGLLALLSVAAVAIPEINVYLNWQAGYQAFGEGNCPEANERFQRILDAPGWGIVNVSSQANQLQIECSAFLRGVDEESAYHYGLAFLNYLDFASVYPASGLNTFIPSRVEALFSKSPPEELATEEVCDRVALQGETKLIPHPDNQLPVLYYYCGRTYESVGELKNAVVLYSFVRTNYPRHQLNYSASQGLARVEIKLAGDAPPIEPPSESGTTPTGISAYVIQNDSPAQMQIILSGPEVVIEEVEACRVCTKLKQETDQCPEKGPIRRITLKPGQYEVLVKSVSDDGVEPFRGTWLFDNGVEYSACYYIVTITEP